MALSVRFHSGSCLLLPGCVGVEGCGWQGGRKYTDVPFAPDVLVHLLLIWPREIGAGAFQTRAVGGGRTVEQRADRDRGPAPFALTFACLAVAWPHWPISGVNGLGTCPTADPRKLKWPLPRQAPSAVETPMYQRAKRRVASFKNADTAKIAKFMHITS